MRTLFQRLSVLALLVVMAWPFQALAQGPGGQPSGADPSVGPVGVSPQVSPQAFSWYDGGIQYSSITNCASIIQGLPYQENGAGAYVGYLADLNAGKPAPNDVYYVHVVVGGLGNSCSGQRAFIDLALPANTVTAVDGTHTPTVSMTDRPCPRASARNRTLPLRTIRALSRFSPPMPRMRNTWPIPQGRILEIQIPVRSTTSLTNSPLRANVWMLDGNSSPWLRPQQGIYVFSGSSSPPTISYPSPSTISVTVTSGHSEAYLYTYGAGGTGYFDLGTTASYGFINEAVVIAAGSTAWVAWDDWGPPALAPDTLYHWRFTFTPSGGSPILGVDQTFRTLPDGRVTVGNGQAASCTPSALNSAFTGAKSIDFDCGSVPITITMSAGRSIAGNLTINGGNKVTLDAGLATNHFDVQAGAQLTLSQLSLVNGVNNVTCGGALNVATGAKLTLNETRFVNNNAWMQGGAICNWGTTDITATLFLSNRSSNSHGGAIGNYGSLRVTNSKFMSNTAKANGGGIDMGGTVAVTTSTFISNTGLRGGGINTYGGNLTVIGSSFISNTANLWGGGLANDASTSMVSGSTFSDNFSAWAGGGLETSGPGSLTLINNTISANRAITDGGGIYWYPGVSTGPISILNSTIASNRAGVQGGNVYVGGIGIYNSGINLKNTIVGSGSPNNCSGTLLSNGNNLEDANSCGLTLAADQRNTNPKLGPLQNNGGATLTRALLLGSPAIDAGTNSGCPATDQRGVARPVDGNRDGAATCDIGAVEAPPSWRAFLPLVLRN